MKINNIYINSFAFAISYFLLALFGKYLTFAHENFVIFWLPAGLSLAVFLKVPKKQWWLYLIALFVGNVSFDIYNSKTLYNSLMFSAANSAEAIIGALLISKYVSKNFAINNVKNFIGLLVCTIGCSTIVGSLLGATIVHLVFGDPYFSTVFSWWTGDITGILVIFPIVIILLSSRSLKQILDIKYFFASVAFTFLLYLSYHSHMGGGITSPIKFIVLPVLIIFALKFTSLQLSILLVIFAIFTNIFVSDDISHIRENLEYSLKEQLLLTQTYIVVSLVCIYILHAVASERIKNENSLKQQSYFLAKAQEIGAIGTWELDVVNNTLKWTEENHNIFGIPLDTELTYETFLGCIHPDDRDYVNEQWTSSVQNKTPYDIDHRILVNGKVKWVREKAELEFDKKGNCIKGTGFTQDITERKALENILKTNEQRFKTILLTAIDGFWCTDNDGNLVDVNDSYCEMSGYSRKELLSMNIKDLEVDESPEDVIEHTIKIKKHGKDRFESKHRRKDGGIYNVEITVTYLRDFEGGQFVAFIRNISDRIKADEITKKTTQELKYSQKISRVGSWFLDLSTSEVVWSEELYRMYGFDSSLPPPPYTEHMKLFTPQSWELLSSSLAQTQRSGIPYELELEIIREEGSTGWMWVVGEDVQDENGKTIALRGAAQDITERKLMSQALLDKEQEYHVLFQEMLDGFALHEIICDDNGNPCNYRFLAINPSFERLTGLSSKNVVGKTVLEIMPQTEKHWIEKYGKVALTGEPIQFEEFASDLNKYFFVTAFQPKKNHFACIFQDITENKQAREKLHQSELQKQAILDGISSNIAYVDKDLRILWSNKTAASSVNKYPQELIGNKCYELWASPDGPCENCPTVRAFKTHKTEHTIMTTPDGKVWDERGEPVFNDKNEVVGVVEIATDITEIKSMEEQLRHSEKMLAIGQLAGGIAHDFNNQLTSILGYSEILINRLDNPTFRKFAENIYRASIRSKDLTQQLLAFARKGKYQMTNVDIHKIIHEVVDLLSHSIDKKIDIKQHFDASNYTIKGDPTQIQNMILNIALNARDAMPKGGEMIFSTNTTVLRENFIKKYLESISPGEYIKISISDNGIGMSKEVQPRIFEPFYTTKDVGQGTGMGLAAVYGTVKSHNGIINVESEIGIGSKFTIYLPLLKNTTQEDKLSKSESVLKSTGTVMVIDDEESIIELATVLLEELGFKVISKLSCQDALGYYKDNWKNIDLVILDMVMPVMGGKEFFNELKNINPEIKCILSSGYSINGEAQSILDDGVIDFLQKPYVIKELSDVIDRVMNR